MSKLRFPVAVAALAALAGLSPAFAQQNPNADRELITQENQNQRRQASGEGLTVKDLIVKKLRTANEGEIELAQMAQEKIDNPQLQQFTQTLIQDHQALNQKLEQVAQGSGQPGQKPQRDADQPRRGDQVDNQRGQQARGGQQQVPSVLCDIMDRASQNMLEMKKEMLQKHEGQDLQMAFLGQQIMTHTMHHAELKAIESSGEFQELQPVLKEAISKVENHLMKAKELAGKFEKDRVGRNATQPNDATQPNRR